MSSCALGAKEEHKAEDACTMNVRAKLKKMFLFHDLLGNTTVSVRYWVSPRSRSARSSSTQIVSTEAVSTASPYSLSP